MTAAALHRVEVRPAPGRPDPRSDEVARRAESLGYRFSRVRCSRVYLIEADLSSEQLRAISVKLLADPVTEEPTIGHAPTGASCMTMEVHPLPGVMDAPGQSVAEAIRVLMGVESRVSTGARYDLSGADEAGAREFAVRALANPVVHQIHVGPWLPRSLPRGSEYRLQVRHVPIRELTDEQLAKLSREAHLFLSIDEMRAVRDEYRKLGREPRDIELETIAQTWSEHCVHKTLKSIVRYKEHADRSISGGTKIEWKGRPGHTINADGSVTIDNLLKRTIAAATHELIEEGVDWALSVFKDNSGVVEFDDRYGVCIKVETHNRPSAIEPYGGAATGVGGCIRDVIGTGLGARPIANMDVFCVADGRKWRDTAANDRRAAPLPPGTLHPTRVLREVVAGVRDYGNRMGIPTVNGAVFFDDRYVGNPLVYCGCVGLIPKHLITGEARPGDHIIAIGGRTGRDGIHGATFSSAELESTTHSEFAHAVQIGNAIEEKRVLEAVIRARGDDASFAGTDGSSPGGGSAPLFNAITDCGAGGFSSAIGEMGGRIGATVHLDRAPLKYAGLSYTEIWISEAQERMILAVPEKNIRVLARICKEEGVELADLGTFGTPGADLVLFYAGTEVGRLPMEFLHEGIPTPAREAVWNGTMSETGKDRRSIGSVPGGIGPEPSIGEVLRSLLAHPNIASKHWIVRQYDHEVRGNTITKPLIGPGQRGPSDAAVLEPVPGTKRGVAIACGLSPYTGSRGDPYQMALAGIDECVRNLVCAGADPNRIAILDNFCWPSCEKPENLGALVRACEGCYDGAKAYRTPFVSGKDSLNNQLRYTDPDTGEAKLIEIPWTLLISGLGVVPNVDRIVTMDAKQPGNVLLLIGRTTAEMGGSHYESMYGSSPGTGAVPSVDLSTCPASARAVAQLIRDGLIESAHDCSDGGLLVGVAEMLIATSGNANGVDGCGSGGDLSAVLARVPLKPLGLEVTIEDDNIEIEQLAFAETPGRYIVECKAEHVQRVRNVIRDFNTGNAAIFCSKIGTLNSSGVMVWERANLIEKVDDLAAAWIGTLDW